MPTNKNKDRTIAVCAATGRQGGAALRQLRQRGFPVRALTRNPDGQTAHALTGPGVEVRRADMDDPASLIRAFDGAYGVCSIQNWHDGGLENEIRQGNNVADTAKRSDIRQFVYHSVASADQKTGIPHFESKFRIEEHIRATGLRYTIVRPAFFMENWFGMRQSIEGGALRLPLDPSTRLQMIAVEDIGGVAAMALEHAEKWQGRAFDIAGAELSMSELAQVFTRASGREVKYVQVPWDEFEQQTGKEITVMYRWFQEVGYHIDIGAVRQEYPKLMSFEQWINAYWHTATQTAR
jgi:uncharacterized protein YbjT (DUF2867 family)